MNKKQMNALKNSAYNPNLKPHPWGNWADEKEIPTDFGTWKDGTEGYSLVADGDQVLAFTREISKKDVDGLMKVHHGAWINDGASVVDLGSFDTVRQARKAVEEKLNG
tara:strand:- start:1454 stop:1777 length:324 start_codon:yes stop_codon:yes gene_type:complete